jgi:hypothetical protein
MKGYSSAAAESSQLPRSLAVRTVVALFVPSLNVHPVTRSHSIRNPSAAMPMISM